MAIHFTPAQKKVIDARGRNLLVSAAAGSGKTAVLVERIVNLVSEGEHPLDIDRLLVVTFTRAAAAQMRERIGQALAARLEKDPANAHLQRQEVLLHNAQITTIDSFCTFLLKNYFSEIDLDPGFRQIEETESRLLAAETMEEFLEDQYAGKDPAFLRCVEYFAPGSDDRILEDLLIRLCDQAGSHPAPDAWLKERAADYEISDREELFAAPWMKSLVLRLTDLLLESESQYRAMKDLCSQPGGPDVCYAFLEEERHGLFDGILHLLPDSETGETGETGEIIETGETGTEGTVGSNGSFSGNENGFAEELLPELWEEIQRTLSCSFARYPAIRGKKYDYIDPALKDTVKAMRDEEKDRIQKLRDRFGGRTVEMILAMMDTAKEPMRTLSSLALRFRERLMQKKRERHVIDFVDLEQFAIEILAERREDGTYTPRRTARELRTHFSEILIDEYQDSNEVQELLLQIISGEEDGRYNRFMVGDIKQSIYRFRLARPEIFMEKYNTYLPEDPRQELIELDQNFRSRGEVLDCVNILFLRMMRPEIGGVEYNETVSLKKGAVFPDEADKDPEGGSSPSPGTGSEQPCDRAAGDPEGGSRPSIHRAEFLLLETESDQEEAEDSGQDGLAAESEGDGGFAETDGPGGSHGEGDEEEAGTVSLAAEIRALTSRQKEALMIAGRIRQIVGQLPVRDEDTGQMRPARYGDIVILLRATKGWNEDLRAVFEREGIPAYAESRTGYFAAEEIRQVMAFLRVLDNPRQDIPLYGVLRGYFGDFSQEEIARIRLAKPDSMLYDALCAAAVNDPKSADFLRELDRWRDRARYCSVSELVAGLLEETGYRDYCAALPAGAQRTANLRLLRSQADAFTKTDYTGLFQFLRYIDGMDRQAIDMGEANILDENADVVRIMSIHKSKGLEFPVCFVAGLSNPFGFRRFDASGPVLFDGDWGCGLYYFDTTSRVQTSTLRREEIAEKIRRDCMGEELRVLYVAMTRAKEKLILTGALKGAVDRIGKWKRRLSGFYQRPDAAFLPAGMISGASSYTELVMEAALAHLGPAAEPAVSGEAGGALFSGEEAEAFPLSIRLYSEEDLRMQTAQDQLDLSRVEEILRDMENRPLAAQPDPPAARALADRVFAPYPHGELADLSAQTSVSELKHRAMEALRAMQAQEEGTVESAQELFPDAIPVPYTPSFAGREEAETGQGARRGTAFHRVVELLDYTRYESLSALDQEELRAWILSLSENGSMAREDAELVIPAHLERFLHSEIASRMAAACQRGQLYREQPFVMGIAADRVRAFGAMDPGEAQAQEETAGTGSLLHREMVTVQGIIDAFFVEDGKIILVDYKTDRVRTPQELAGRYRTQLDLYAEALEKAMEMPVAEKLLYSTALGETIRLGDL